MFEIVDLVDTNVHFILDDEIEQLIGVLFEFIPCRNVVEKCRAKNFGILRREAAVSNLSLLPSLNVTITSFPRTYAIANGGTAPLALPKLANVPFRAKQSRLRSKVALPTPSNAAATPCLFVASSTLALTSSWL